MNLHEYLKSHNEANSALLLDEEKLHAIVAAIALCIEKGGTIWTAGNGGSASTASHLTCDLAKGVLLARQSGVKSFCLNDNMAVNTAWANDFSYDVALERQLEIYAAPGDIFIAISGSGESPNIINALNAAKRMGIKSIALLGFEGGSAVGIADLPIVIKSNDMQVVENLHMVITHWIFKALH
jgi:D-sedoheptulose 7-phosphate isomerase